MPCDRVVSQHMALRREESTLPASAEGHSARHRRDNGLAAVRPFGYRRFLGRVSRLSWPVWSARLAIVAPHRSLWTLWHEQYGGTLPRGPEEHDR